MNNYRNNIGIIGYSGHSFICIEMAQINKMNIIGYYDQNEKIINPFNLSYLGDEENAPKELELFIAIGNNKVRESIFNKLILLNKSLNVTLIHPSSIISNSSIIGPLSLLAAGVIINPLAEIGKGCIINTSSIIEHECKIEQFSHIAPGAVLAGNVQIGSSSFIGANSVIKQGVKIGKNVIVGAGTVVLNDVPDNCTIVGNPGKFF
jgi:sugar O-acyltransferase (sialic acid O-acetyltransferase NeuD family)